MQFSVTVRNDRLDTIESTIGTTPVLEIRTGAPPANCATADSGSVLATINLPSDWMAAASSGSKGKSGTWQDAAADADGTAGHFRIYDTASPRVCHIQGTVGLASASPAPDMSVDNDVFATGQQFTINTFTITDGNA